jgi:hypothetical protein
MDLQIVMNHDGNTTRLNIDSLEIQKMLFVYNALEDGWRVEKDKVSYLFKKKHEEKKEYFSDSYLKDFIKTHFNFVKTR